MCVCVCVGLSVSLSFCLSTYWFRLVSRGRSTELEGDVSEFLNGVFP